MRSNTLTNKKFKIKDLYVAKTNNETEPLLAYKQGHVYFYAHNDKKIETTLFIEKFMPVVLNLQKHKHIYKSFDAKNIIATQNLTVNLDSKDRVAYLNNIIKNHSVKAVETNDYTYM